MTVKQVGAYLLLFFFIGIPLSAVLWILGIWADNPVKEENLFQTAGVATVLTVAFGFLGGILISD